MHGGVGRRRCGHFDGRFGIIFRCRRNRLFAAEDPLQQAGPLDCQRFAEQLQRLALQVAQFFQQGRHLADLAGAGLDIAGESLERGAHISRQLQRQQLLDELGQRLDGLLDALLAAPLGVQHGLLQSRNQARQAGVHLFAAEDFTQLLHALVDRLVAAFGGQAAAHQAAAQQVETGLPAALDTLLLFEVLEVLVLPALAVVAAHAGAPVLPRARAEDLRKTSGRRISTATGR
ncbi:hypothetical protein D3C81_906280 [compost metagenome]